ncbi:hypothetical protein FH972_022106 [Carpinus fangiana]|uniref:Uncharacterized protein n=1 Tax=Carpinus fangiana TaxID=176857 RepID=A0A5N6KTG7_9ROSI|nr:hypothetical protein FH972_022106 [Carpinus fangiana]
MYEAQHHHKTPGSQKMSTTAHHPPQEKEIQVTKVALQSDKAKQTPSVPQCLQPQKPAWPPHSRPSAVLNPAPAASRQRGNAVSQRQIRRLNPPQKETKNIKRGWTQEMSGSAGLYARRASRAPRKPRA